MNEVNLVSKRTNPTVTEKDIQNLKKAHCFENELIKNGYRWHTINQRTKVLIECDENGQPTVRGERQIRMAKEKCIVTK